MDPAHPIAEANAELARRGLHMSMTFGARHDGEFPDGLPWTCKLLYERRRMTVAYYAPPGLEEEPTAAEVLASLFREIRACEQARDFVAFCQAFGFERDRRRSEWTYAARGEVARRLGDVLGADYGGLASVVADVVQGTFPDR